VERPTKQTTQRLGTHYLCQVIESDFKLT
jgi:hypothetical protein